MRSNALIAAVVFVLCVAGCSPAPAPRDVARDRTPEENAASGPATTENPSTASRQSGPETVPAIAVSPDKPFPGKTGSVGLCPDGYKYVPYTGTCTRKP